MSDTTKIQWADATWNPWLGCSKVSEGCANCYITSSAPFRVRGLKHGQPRQRTSPAYWRQPLRWNKNAIIAGTRPSIFPSLCDWLDDEVPIEWLVDFLKLIYRTPNLEWLLLTKRPELFAKRIGQTPFDLWDEENPPRNVWLGVSVENQAMADKRIQQLRKIPAKIHFLSVEPLLGPVSLLYSTFDGSESFHNMAWIDWVILGGESGPNARPCNIGWIGDVLAECQGANVPCFVKQVGQNPFCDNANMFEWPEDLELQAAGAAFAACKPLFRDKKGGDPAEWPEDLRVREFPVCR